MRDAAASATTAVSTSSSVVQRPNERRIAASDESSETFMARRTGDGSWVPAWHADPVDAAMAEHLASRSWPWVPTMLRFSVLGSRRTA